MMRINLSGADMETIVEVFCQGKKCFPIGWCWLAIFLIGWYWQVIIVIGRCRQVIIVIGRCRQVIIIIGRCRQVILLIGRCRQGRCRQVMLLIEGNVGMPLITTLRGHLSDKSLGGTEAILGKT